MTGSNIDPQTELFLSALKSPNGKRLENMEIEEAREGMKALMLAHQISLTTNNGPHRKEIIQGARGNIPIRIYQAVSSDRNENAIILFLHGGGWVLGDLDCYENMLQYLCQKSRVTMIGVEYSLSPEHKFPTALHDCYAALLWIKNNKHRLVNREVSRIFVMGDSAGANLAAALCLYTRDIRGPEIHTQILLYPQLSLEEDNPFVSRDKFGKGEFFISRGSINWAVEHYLNKKDEASSYLASPILADDYSCFPRSLIISAGLDPLHDEGESFVEKLKNSGVDTEYWCFEDTIHGFLSFAGTLQRGKQGLDYIADWLRQHT